MNTLCFLCTKDEADELLTYMNAYIHTHVFAQRCCGMAV